MGGQQSSASLRKIQQPFSRIIASLVPKEVKSTSSPFDALTEAELEMLADAAGRALACSNSTQ
jgi:hypothetical protein